MSSYRRTSIALTLGSALVLTAALARPAAAAQIRVRVAARTPVYTAYGESGSLFAVEGTLTDEGRRCQALRDRNGRLYNLVGDRFEGLEIGDHVTLLVRRVLPRYATACGPGATVRVGQVQAVWIGPGHSRALFDSRRDGAYTPYMMRERRATLDRYGRYDRDGRYDRNGDGRYDDRDRGYDARGQSTYDDSYRGDRNGDGVYDQDRYDRYDGDRSDDGSYGREDDSYRRVVSVTGRISSSGRCVTVRDRDGRTFALTGNLGRYGVGDTVKLVGVLGDDSECGPTIDVQDVSRP